MPMFVRPKWYIFFQTGDTYFYLGRCTRRQLDEFSTISSDLVFVNPMDIEQFISDYACFCGGEKIGK